MVMFTIQITSFVPVNTLLLGMPESVGLLVFGLGLTATAVAIRWLLGPTDEVRSDEADGEKV